MGTPIATGAMLTSAAEHAGLMLARHFAMELHLHLGAACPAEPWVKQFDWLEPLFNERLQIAGGRLRVPGLGLSDQARAWTRQTAEFGVRP
jgi:hypothetical protein